MNTSPLGLDPITQGLHDAVTSIERHAAELGWDGPVMVFALVRTRDAAHNIPNFRDELTQEVRAASEADPNHLTAIEQTGLPESSTLEQLLAQLAWPETVDGAAIVVERQLLPPEAERDMPQDEGAALEYLRHHPDRDDVRLAVGALRSGQTWCALRTRSNDADDAVAGSPDAVPGLVAALQSTFE